MSDWINEVLNKKMEGSYENWKSGIISEVKEMKEVGVSKEIELELLLGMAGAFKDHINQIVGGMLEELIKNWVEEVYK